MSDIEQPAPVETAAATGPRPGRELAAAREQRNQTIAEIAQQLKLSPHQVEALEADDYARLPGPVFVRGFVRNYARLVELDGESLVSRLELSQISPAAINAVPHSQDIPFQDAKGTRWPLLAAAVVLLAAIVLMFEWLMPDAAEVPAPAPVAVPLPANSPSLPSAVEATETVAPAAPPLDVSAVQAAPVSSAVSSAASVPAAPVTTPVPAASSAMVASVAAAPVAAATKPVVAGGSELRFLFERQSWVEVRDRNDRVVFSQLNPAGAMQTVQGTAPLNVVIGNAAGVKLSYKGKTVDLAPHTKTDVARLVLE